MPKLLGLPGGVLLAARTLRMVALSLRADQNVGDANAWGDEMGLVLLLRLVAVSGLALYVLGSTLAMSILLALHLRAVLSFFLLTPFTKMAHGFYQLVALVREA